MIRVEGGFCGTLTHRQRSKGGNETKDEMVHRKSAPTWRALDATRLAACSRASEAAKRAKTILVCR